MVSNSSNNVGLIYLKTVLAGQCPWEKLWRAWFLLFHCGAGNWIQHLHAELLQEPFCFLFWGKGVAKTPRMGLYFQSSCLRRSSVTTVTVSVFQRLYIDLSLLSECAPWSFTTTICHLNSSIVLRTNCITVSGGNPQKLIPPRIQYPGKQTCLWPVLEWSRSLLTFPPVGHSVWHFSHVHRNKHMLTEREIWEFTFSKLAHQLIAADFPLKF